MSNTCLVTGAAGFIGSHLSDGLIERGKTVIGLENRELGCRRPVVTSRRDVSAREAAGETIARLNTARTVQRAVPAFGQADRLLP